MRSLKSFVLQMLRSARDRWPRSDRVRRILLDSRSTLAASYLEDFRGLFAGDPRLRFYKMVRPTLPPEDRRRCLALVQCPAIAHRVAKFFPWDLIVLADHPADQIEEFGTRFGILRIPHGLGSKLVNGRDYFYGPSLYNRDGRLRYSCIFESSESRRAQAVAANPALAGVVRLVGDIRVDKLVRTSSRAHRRPSRSDRPTVLLAASWSAGNLFEKLGPRLFDEAAALLDRYAFVVRPHPHAFSDGAVPHAGPRPANQRAGFEALARRGFVISPPSEDAGWQLAAASVVICDDLTSLALYAAVLGRKIVIVPSGSDQLAPNSFGARLAEIEPHLYDAIHLRSAIETALLAESPPGLKALAAEINSRPGQASRLVRNEFYRLVHLPRSLCVSPTLVSATRSAFARQAGL